MTFLGKQDHVERLIPKHHVLLMPSEMEAFGLAALEAMACGVPPVATRVGGVPELIDDGVDGFLEPVGDIAAQAARVVSLLTDDALYRTNVRRGAARRRDALFDLADHSAVRAILQGGLRAVNILAIGPHPDDIEFGCAPILIKEVRAGNQVKMLVLSRGEAGSAGTPEGRERESRKAARLMGADGRISGFRRRLPSRIHAGECIPNRGGDPKIPAGDCARSAPAGKSASRPRSGGKARSRRMPLRALWRP